jgi:hypothetical protein
VIGNLGREVHRHPQRHAQDIQEPEKRMPPQMAENVPPKNAKILCLHLDDPLY